MLLHGPLKRGHHGEVVEREPEGLDEDNQIVLLAESEFSETARMFTAPGLQPWCAIPTAWSMARPQSCRCGQVKLALLPRAMTIHTKAQESIQALDLFVAADSGKHADVSTCLKQPFQSDRCQIANVVATAQ